MIHGAGPQRTSDPDPHHLVQQESESRCLEAQGVPVSWGGHDWEPRGWMSGDRRPGPEGNSSCRASSSPGVLGADLSSTRVFQDFPPWSWANPHPHPTRGPLHP